MKHAWLVPSLMLLTAVSNAGEMPPEYAWLLTEYGTSYLSYPTVEQASGKLKAQTLGLITIDDETQAKRICDELFILTNESDSASLETLLKDREFWTALAILFEMKRHQSVAWLISRFPGCDIQQKAGIIRCMKALKYREVYAFLAEELDDQAVVPHGAGEAAGEPSDERVADRAYTMLVHNLRSRDVPLPAGVPLGGTSTGWGIAVRDANISALKVAITNDPVLSVAMTNLPYASPPP